MATEEMPPPGWLARALGAESNGLKIVNLSLFAALAALALTHITYHMGYAAGPIAFVAVACLAYIGSILDRDNAENWQLLSVVAAMFGTATTLWYTHSFVLFGAGVLIITIPALSYLLQLATLRDGMLTFIMMVLMPIMAVTSYTIPGESVSRSRDGQYTYQAESVIGGFFSGEQVAYYNLSSGSLNITGLPEDWSVVGTFTLPPQAEMTSENFEKIFSVASGSEGTLTALTIPLPSHIDLTAAEDPAASLSEWLREEYSPVKMVFTVTQRIVETNTWHSPN